MLLLFLSRSGSLGVFSVLLLRMGLSHSLMRCPNAINVSSCFVTVPSHPWIDPSPGDAGYRSVAAVAELCSTHTPV